MMSYELQEKIQSGHAPERIWKTIIECPNCKFQWIEWSGTPTKPKTLFSVQTHDAG
jgi:hypothetical protein